jgi:catechol 2,3-dioxygenase-like lactoylglutathione lyase family enzyme
MSDGESGQEPAMSGVKIQALNHIGVRVRELQRSAQWYAHLGFRLIWQSQEHTVACLRNDEIGAELNLIFNSNDANMGKNVLMDVEPKYPGFNHLSFVVPSIRETIDALKAADIEIREGLSHSAGRLRYSFETQISMSSNWPSYWQKSVDQVGEK